MLRQGAVTRDGDREAVVGMVMMIMGGNSRQVVGDVKTKIAEIEKSLPAGVTIDTFYDRTELVAKTIHTVGENIGLGVLLVVVTLFVLLGDVRAGLIVAAAIPLSAMCALIAMRYAGVSANLMSLGAIDFGVIVDGAVVMVEFVPTLDEGDIAIQAVRLPSVSLETSVEMTKAMERTLLKFPQVETVVSKTGRPEIANDPMGVYQTDMLIRLDPHAQYAGGESKPDLIERMKTALLREVPGNTYSFTQPIQLRVQELVAGVRSDIGLSLYGDDLDLLKIKGDELVRALNQVPGAADVQAQQIAGLSYFRVKVRRDDLARYGINARDVLDAVSTVGGMPIGQVFEGQRRFPLQVRLRPESRENTTQLLNLKIDDSQGRPIPISQVADIVTEDGPVEISREAVRRRLLVQCNVRGRDLAGFVAEAQSVVDEEVELPTGYTLRWGGQFENLQQATQRLSIAVPVALILIFALLYMTFSSVKLALLIYLNVPIAATGGVLALWARDLPFSISAGVGFIALFGIAVMNGVVLIEHVRHLRRGGDSQRDAVIHGTIDRLRPVLMTACCGALGFIPMAVSASSGAEVQRPLATVVIGGLITSTALTLLVLPTIYRWFEPRHVEPEVIDKAQFEH